MSYARLVHVRRFPYHTRLHVRLMFRTDIIPNEVSHLKAIHVGHFQFYARHVLAIWRMLMIIWAPLYQCACNERLIWENMVEFVMILWRIRTWPHTVVTAFDGTLYTKHCGTIFVAISAMSMEQDHCFSSTKISGIFY